MHFGNEISRNNHKCQNILLYWIFAGEAGQEWLPTLEFQEWNHRPLLWMHWGLFSPNFFLDSKQNVEKIVGIPNGCKSIHKDRGKRYINIWFLVEICIFIKKLNAFTFYVDCYFVFVLNCEFNCHLHASLYIAFCLFVCFFFHKNPI